MNDQTCQRYGAILTVYLLGLLLGGLYVGMVAPVRTVVQAQFGLNDSTGIWMINIYTLFYAALIPVIGKIADRCGRNRVFSICVLIFMAGAGLCALSSSVGGFGLLLIGRVIQAAGAGGMIPVANAEIGTSFPEDRRGLALGIAAGVTGIANVAGAGLGSFIVGAAGADNWAVMFYGAIPFCIILFILARVFLRSNVKTEPDKMDYTGSVLLVLFVLLLLFGFKELDSWKPFAGSAVCFVAFALAERRAENPVFHTEFIHSRPVVITMVTSFFIGCIIVSMMLIPEYAEFIMKDPVGSGGYYMLVIGIASMIGPPVGGRFIDRFGPKKVLIAGLLIMLGGYLLLAFYVSVAPSAAALVFGLAVVGLGMGFAMGAPTNYMILESSSPEDSTSAIATITLIRQIGTTIAPAVFVRFISGRGDVTGYQHMILCVAACCAIAVIVMLLYRSPEKK